MTELAEEIERLSKEFEALAANKGGKIEHRAIAAAKLESTLMVNRDQIIAALRRGPEPVLGECEECGHTVVTPLKRLPERPPSGEMVTRLTSLRVGVASFVVRNDPVFSVGDVQVIDDAISEIRRLRTWITDDDLKTYDALAAEAEGRKG